MKELSNDIVGLQQFGSTQNLLILKTVFNASKYYLIIQLNDLITHSFNRRSLFGAITCQQFGV